MHREELQQPVFAAIDVLEFPELHDESIPFMAFMTNVMRLMAAAGVRDFTMQVRHCTLCLMRSDGYLPHGVQEE